MRLQKAIHVLHIVFSVVIYYSLCCS